MAATDQDSKSPRSWRPTLRLTIGVVLSGLTLLTASALTTVSYLSSRRTLLEASRSSIRQNAELVREQVRGYLDPARSAAALTLSLVESGMVETSDLKELERYFFEFLTVHQTVAMLNYGAEDGNFVMVKRQPDGSLSTKVITGTGPRRVLWRHRDPGGACEPPRVEEEDPQDLYDPRTRPWYRGAVRDRGLHWTSVYLFHSDQKPGVTAAVPRLDVTSQLAGVLSVDVALVDLSYFLRDRIQVGESGQAFLLDHEERLIAVPQVEALTVQDDLGSRLRPLRESPSPELAALAEHETVRAFQAQAFQGGPPPEPITLRYQADGRDFVATFLPIEVGPGRRWLAGAVALEDDFLAGAKQANTRALLAGLGILLLALIVAGLIARSMSRSLCALVAETTRVRRLEIEMRHEQSRFREVDDVLSAFESMKTGLRAFQKYVPKKLAEQLVEGQIEPELGGEVRSLSILFCDIRDFTSISERLAPLELARVLEEFLSAVTSTIHKHEGTVDKYIGDCVMAFWGAPRRVPNHAIHACHAALACCEAIRRLQNEEPSLPELFTRFGVHSDRVVVGNFGSSDRLNYTVLGDGVNLASRLEGANKAFGTQILISEDTQSYAAEHFETRRIGPVAVKGRERPVFIYELLGSVGAVAAERLRQAREYEEALELYLGRRFEEAGEAFTEVLAIAPGDVAARQLAAASREFAASPPAADWEGVITLHSK